MDERNLSERKRKILYALVDSYINSAEPISSGNIKQQYLPDVSSATIRNELASLEEMGYLVKPHVSAGRIPSSKAYKFYVESLNIGGELQTRDVEDLRTHFNIRLQELEEVIKDTAKIISDETNYTSIIVVGGEPDLIIREVKMVELGDLTALVIIITDAGVIRDKVVSLPVNLTEDYISTATRILNEVFCGKKVGETDGTFDFIDEKLEEFKIVFEQVAEMLSEMRSKKSGTVYLEGQSKIFDYPEYEDIGNVKQFLQMIESNEKLSEIIGNDEDIEFSIKIGKDDELQNMAIVTARYSVNGKEIGRAGVIGPERMNYKKVIKVLSSVKKATKRISKESKTKE